MAARIENEISDKSNYQRKTWISVNLDELHGKKLSYSEVMESANILFKGKYFKFSYKFEIEVDESDK